MNRRSNASCLTEREIEEFLFNRLSGVTREVVEEHLLVCPKCLDKVEREEEYFETVRAAARSSEKETLERAFAGVPERGLIQRWASRFVQPFGGTNRRLWTVAAASLVLMSTAILWQNRLGGRQQFQEVSLELHRGAFVSAEARAGVPLSLSIAADDLAAGNYTIQLVDATGHLLGETRSSTADGKLTWRLAESHPPGTYWIRLRRPENTSLLVREYGLTLVK